MYSRRLKAISDALDWNNEGDRFRFLRHFITLTENWQGPLPNLLDIFQPEEIERLLLDSIIYEYGDPHRRRGETERFLAFVISTGYVNVPGVDENGEPLVHRTTPLHLLASREDGYHSPVTANPLLSELLKIYNRYDVNYTDEDGLTHFHVACRYAGKDVVERFLDAGHDPNLAVRKTGDTALHSILNWFKKETIELLLSRGADPNRANAKGETPLHGLSEAPFAGDELAEMLCRGDESVPLQIDARDNEGSTPLHSALRNNRSRLGAFLLRRGADPNAVDRNGQTPLHALCRKFSRIDTMAMLFGVSQKMGKRVRIDAQDNEGDTPLNLALRNNYEDVVKFLLKRGADPNLANAKGSTPLHIICQATSGPLYDTHYKWETFFKLIYESRHSVRTVNARDESGDTALHYALKNRNKKLVELLLRRGCADPNLPNAKGLAPVQMIQRTRRSGDDDDDDGLADLFFKINRQLGQPVLLRDALYDETRTLLQWAVATLRPTLVYSFLRTGGADANSFVFPTEADFDELCVKSHKLKQRLSFYEESCPIQQQRHRHRQNGYKLEVILDAVSVIRHLQNRGYKLARPDALTIMKLFEQLGLYADADESFDEDKFTDASKTIMINSSQAWSLHDLMHWPLDKAANKFSFGQFKLAVGRRLTLQRLSADERDAVQRKMTATLLMQFTRAWAMYSFKEMTLGKRLPDICYDMIFEELSSKDFLNVTIAGEL